MTAAIDLLTGAMADVVIDAMKDAAVARHLDLPPLRKVEVRVLDQAQPMVVAAEVEQEPLEEMQQLQLVVQVEQDQVHLLYRVLR